jgi:hypothetical protein
MARELVEGFRLMWPWGVIFAFCLGGLLVLALTP